MAQPMGALIDQWGAVVVRFAPSPTKLEEAVIAGIKMRGVSGFSFARGEFGAAEKLLGKGWRTCVWLQRKLPDGGVASVALRVVRETKKDVNISWVLIGQNALQAAALGLVKVVGGTITVASWGAAFITSVLGGFFGLEWLPAHFMGKAVEGLHNRTRGKPSLTEAELREARAFAAIVDAVLMEVLAHHGVSGRALRVYQHAQMEGVGLLPPSDISATL